jgi:AcrR family transcriptional regulator
MRAERLRAARREQILRCARRLLAERGYHRTSVADIIERAGVSRGTFYLHFSSKRAVFEEFLEGFFARLAATVRRIDVGEGAPPAIDQMRANAMGLVTILLRERDATRVLLREAGIDAEFDRKLDEFYGRLLARIIGGIELGQKMGLVRPCRPDVTAACILGSFKEVVYRYAVAGDKTPEASVLAEEILGYVIRALFVSSPT